MSRDYLIKASKEGGGSVSFFRNYKSWKTRIRLQIHFIDYNSDVDDEYDKDYAISIG
jgi:hypothetical protein